MQKRVIPIRIVMFALAALALGSLMLFISRDKAEEVVTPSPSPFAGKTLYRAEMQSCFPGGDLSEGETLAAAFICDQPTARWIVGDIAEWSVSLSSQLAEAGASGTYPVLALYNIPNRDCGLYAAQEAPISSEEYLAWVEEVAEEIGSHEVAIILEPDALPQVATQESCFEASGPLSKAERIRLIREALSILKQNPGTAVYLDAGNAAWAETEEMAALLKEAGVKDADGFSLNVSFRATTEDSIAYGKEIAKRIEGKGFVIDTSRNGNDNPANPNDWCNPEDEALGELPTTTTPDPFVHALLWVKAPGESDGECGKGHPPAGALWPYKLETLYINSQHAQ